MLTNIGYIGIIVKDVAEATAFYRDTLGFTLEGAAPTMAQFETGGGAILGIQLPDFPQVRGQESEQPFEPAFIVEDVDATYATWKARGVEMLEEPNERPFGRTFIFRAPQGHIFRVFKPIDTPLA
ncbi:MAG TPA: VOC family protein [Ktedonobacterales bacterium]|jgi:predicted enzyme related to lactoylglutathione lyase